MNYLCGLNFKILGCYIYKGKKYNRAEILAMKGEIMANVRLSNDYDTEVSFADSVVEIGKEEARAYQKIMDNFMPNVGVISQEEYEALENTIYDNKENKFDVNNKENKFDVNNRDYQDIVEKNNKAFEEANKRTPNEIEAQAIESESRVEFSRLRGDDRLEQNRQEQIDNKSGLITPTSASQTYPIKHSNGSILGLVHNGKVYINPKRENLETRMHEYGGHLFFAYIKENNRRLFDLLDSKFDEIPQDIKDSVEENYPELEIGSPAYRDEVMSTYMGKINREGVKEAIKMWFKKIFIPECDIKSSEIEIIKIKSLWDLVAKIK